MNDAARTKFDTLSQNHYDNGINFLLQYTGGKYNSFFNLYDAKKALVEQILLPSSLKDLLYQASGRIHNNLEDCRRFPLDKIAEMYDSYFYQTNGNVDRWRYSPVSVFDESYYHNRPCREEIVNPMMKGLDESLDYQPVVVADLACSNGEFMVNRKNAYMAYFRKMMPDSAWEHSKDSVEKMIIEELLVYGDENPNRILETQIRLDPAGKFRHTQIQVERDSKGVALYEAAFRKAKALGVKVFVGNPPYQKTTDRVGKDGKQKASAGFAKLWPEFVELAYKHLDNDGYLCFVHPSGWRKPNDEKSAYGKVQEVLTRKMTLKNLKIYNASQGKKIFNAGTRADCYVAQKKPYSNTLVKITGEDGKDNVTRISPIIPNMDFDFVSSFLGSGCDVLYNCAYHASNSLKSGLMRRTKEGQYTLPVVNKTNKDGVELLYSKENKGHFGTPKVIFAEGSQASAFWDEKGEYGMTEQCMAIPVDNKEDADNLLAFLKSKEWERFKIACKWGNIRIEWRMFLYLKPKFWETKILPEKASA